MKSLGWIGFLKIVPSAVSLLSGVLGVIQAIIILYSDNPSQIWQKQLFWSFVYFSFFISAFIAWGIEHKKVIDLEKQIEEGNSKLDIKVKDLYITVPKAWDELSTFILTVSLKGINRKPQPNTMMDCKLFIEQSDGIIEGELQKTVYLKTEAGEYENRIAISPDLEGFKNPPIFSEGIPQDFSLSFKFNQSENPYDDTGNIGDKFYTLKFTDSYNLEYEMKDKISKDIYKTLKILSP